MASRGRDGTVPDVAESRVTRKVAAKAVRRLGVLEVALLGGNLALALVAGALVAFLLAEALDWSFRPTWSVASLLLFVVPGVATWLRDREPDRRVAGEVASLDATGHQEPQTTERPNVR